MPIVTSQRKIEIPETILNFLNISIGDEIEFNISGQTVLLQKKNNKKHQAFRKYIGYLSHLHEPDTDRIINDLRGETDVDKRRFQGGQ